MDKLKTTNVGGFPLVLNDLRWFFGRLGTPDEGIYQAFNNLLRGFGDNLIIQGCVEGGAPGAITLTEGWILLDGELIKVDAQTAFNEATDNKFVKGTTFDARGNKEFQNGSIDGTYEKNRADITGTVGNLAYNGERISDIVSAWIDEDFDAGDFTTAAGTWTIIDGNVTNQSKTIGKKMIVNIVISGSSISGSATGFVKIKIPQSKSAATKLMFSVGKLVDINGKVPCTFQVDPSDDTIKVQTLDETDIGIGGLTIFGQITFEID